MRGLGGFRGSRCCGVNLSKLWREGGGEGTYESNRSLSVMFFISSVLSALP